MEKILNVECYPAREPDDPIEKKAERFHEWSQKNNCAIVHVLAMLCREWFEKEENKLRKHARILTGSGNRSYIIDIHPCECGEQNDDRWRLSNSQFVELNNLYDNLYPDE